MKVLVTFGLGLAAALSASSASAAVDLIQDGNFTAGTPAPNSPGYYTYNTGEQVGNPNPPVTPTPWYVGTSLSFPGNFASVDLISTYFGAGANTPGGGGSVDLDGTLNGNYATGPGSIYQSFTPTTTGEYQLSFYISGNQDGNAGLRYFESSISGIGARTGSTNNNARDGQWTQVTEDVFLIGGTPYTLTIGSLDTDQSSVYGPVVADVSLNSVPEPSTWALMLLGFAGLGFAGYRSRKAVSIAA